jgi:hypothetical protein
VKEIKISAAGAIIFGMIVAKNTKLPREKWHWLSCVGDEKQQEVNERQT